MLWQKQAALFIKGGVCIYREPACPTGIVSLEPHIVQSGAPAQPGFLVLFVDLVPRLPA